MSDLAAGTRVGRWTITRKLGQGGMGAVYEAEDPQLGRLVALKLMLADEPELLRRFEREVAAAAAIHHENVAATLGCFPLGGRLVMVVELLPGGSLKDLVKKRGPLPWREAARLGAGIARGLAAVHAAGYVHRDVKPENVLLDAAQVPKLTDFGLVRGEPGQGSISLTKTGEILGTVEFMSPEQADDGRKVEARSDLYSLGATLHYLVTAHAPFEGESSFQILKRVVTTTPERPSKLAPRIPEEIDDLIMKLLAKRPEERPESAEGVAVTLEALAAGRIATKQSPALLATGLAGIAVVAALVGYFAVGRSRPPVTPFADHVAPAGSATTGPSASRTVEWRLPAAVRAIAFAKMESETVLLTGGKDMVLHVLEPRTGKERSAPFPAAGSGIHDIAVSSAGRVVLVGLENGHAVAWDFGGKELGSARPDGNSESVVALSPDGDQAVAVGTDLRVRVWNPRHGPPERASKLRNAEGDFDDLGKAPPGLGDPAFLWYRSKTVVIYGQKNGQDGYLDLSSLDSVLCNGGNVRGPMRGGVALPGPTEDEDLFVTVGRDAQIVVQALDRLLAEPVGRMGGGKEEPMLAIAALPGGGSVVTGGEAGLCQEWIVRAGGTMPMKKGEHHVRAPDQVNALVVSPDGRLLACGGEDGTVLLFDLPSWKKHERQ